ncbi:MAG: tandem-95 repeat protein, partial [Bacteroidales bacterium]|nr:tandem-95 repeat protein [Bacteroidales bacterium]
MHPIFTQPIPNVTTNEDATNTVLALGPYVNDIDNNNADIIFTVTSNSNSALVQTSISGQQLTLVQQPNRHGTASIVVTANSNGQLARDTFQLTVNAIDDRPVIGSIPAQITAEGINFDTLFLAPYTTEVDGQSVTYSAINTTPLQLVFNQTRDYALVTLPNNDWNGSVSITFIVRDNTIAALSDSIAVVFTATPVDDAPRVVNPIEDVEVNEDAGSTIIQLENVFTDIDSDNALLTIGISNNSKPGVVQASLLNRVLTLNFAADSSGTAVITLTASSDGKSVSHSFNVTVNPVDDAPVLFVGTNQFTIPEGSFFDSLNLNQILTEVDNDPVVWSFAGNTSLMAKVEAGRFIVTTPNPNWYGQETIRLIVRDDTGPSLSDTIVLQYTVNNIDDDPYFTSPLPNVNLFEDQGTYAAFKVSDYVNDIDNLPLSWSYSILSNSNPGLVTAALFADTLKLTPISQQNGQANVIIQVISNGKIITDSVGVTVQAIDDAPVLQPIASVNIQEGAGIAPINLNEYLTEHDGDNINWIVECTDTAIHMNVVNDILFFSIPDTNYYGVAVVLVEAIDVTANQYSDIVNFTIAVTNIDDAPVVGNPVTDQSINEDSPTFGIYVGNVFNDIDNDNNNIYLSTSASVPGLVNLAIVNDTLLITPVLNRNGITNVRLRATSNGKSVTDTFRLTLNAVDDYPILNNIPNATIFEGGVFANVNLNAYTTEVDGDILNWTAIHLGSLNVSISPTGVAQVSTPHNNWYGGDTIGFVVHDVTANAYSDTTFVIFRVQPVDDPPFVANALPDLYVNEDSTGIFVLLGNVFSDIDNNDASIEKQLAGLNNPGLLSAYISNDTLRFSLLENANGNARVMIRAMSNGLVVTDTFMVQVVPVDDAPVIGFIASQTIGEGANFAPR